MEELTLGERRRRTFSESFKRKKVQEIETGQARICEICRAYQVSYTNVYRWIKKYGSMSKKQERLIVETESDSVKLIELQKKVAELERIIGQKQIEIDFKDKMIDIAEEMYGVDIKKSYARSHPALQRQQREVPVLSERAVQDAEYQQAGCVQV